MKSTTKGLTSIILAATLAGCGASAVSKEPVVNYDLPLYDDVYESGFIKTEWCDQAKVLMNKIRYNVECDENNQLSSYLNGSVSLYRRSVFFFDHNDDGKVDYVQDPGLGDIKTPGKIEQTLFQEGLKALKKDELQEIWEKRWR